MNRISELGLTHFVNIKLSSMTILVVLIISLVLKNPIYIHFKLFHSNETLIDAAQVQ